MGCDCEKTDCIYRDTEGFGICFGCCFGHNRLTSMCFYANKYDIEESEEPK